MNNQKSVKKCLNYAFFVERQGYLIFNSRSLIIPAGKKSKKFIIPAGIIRGITVSIYRGLLERKEYVTKIIDVAQIRLKDFAFSSEQFHFQLNGLKSNSISISNCVYECVSLESGAIQPGNEQISHFSLSIYGYFM